MTSEFNLLSLTSATDAIPIDLAGARQVIIQVTDTMVRISNDQSMNDYFTIFTSNGGVNCGLTIESDDDRLWVVAPTGAATLEVWVIR
jgi:hypothetical protein